MMTTNIYYDLALQKITSLILPCVSLPKDQELFRKGKFEQYPALQLAAKKILKNRRERSSANDDGGHQGNDKKTLAIVYAQDILQSVFNITSPTKLSISLYAKQLLKSQREIYVEKYPSRCKRALIISPDPLEQNIFSTLLRSQHIVLSKAKNKMEVLQKLSSHVDILIISSAFQAMDAHAVAQITSATAVKPMLISISDDLDETLKKLGFQITLRHPFSPMQFLEALKQFL